MKSKQKTLLAVFGLSALLLLGYVITLWLTMPPRITIAGNDLVFEVADEPAEKSLGLSGRQSLPDDKALLFTYESEGYYGFWMKDMNFPIDIIWLNQDKEVVYIKENATPQSYPEVFNPDQPAQFVVEVNAGFTRDNNLMVGDTVQFDID